MRREQWMGWMQKDFLSDILSLQGLAWLGMILTFSLLPLKSDVSGFAVGTLIVLFVLAGRRTPMLTQGTGKSVLWSFVLFAAVALLSCLLNPETLSKYIRVLLWGACLLGGFLFSRLFPVHKGRFLQGLMFTLTASCLIWAGTNLVMKQNFDFMTEQRISLYTMHPSRIGLVCALVALYATNCATQVTRLSTRIFFSVLTLFFCTVMFFSGSRAIVLFLPFALLLIPILHYRRHVMKIVAVGGLALVLISGILVVGSGQSLQKQRLFSAVTGLVQDTTFRTRLPIWEAGWAAFNEAPLLGHGVKSYREFHAGYLAAHEAEWKQRYGDLYEPSVKQAHNIVLGRLAETGLLGAITFFAFYGLAVVAAFRGEESLRWVGVFLLYYFCIGLVDDPLFRVSDSFVFILAGLAAGTGNIREYGYSASSQLVTGIARAARPKKPWIRGERG